MTFKTLVPAAALLLLGACSAIGTQPVYPEDDPAIAERHARILAAAPHPNYVGQPEWFEWVDTATGVVDAQGHGPDHDSTEWCHAVHFKVFGHRADETVVCDRLWQKQVDSALRKDRGLLDIF
ncbi:hypothetical protein FOZ76_15750 [Verticiella sediminum]|uniref:Lipoprotein n=1 Tax=Verticiella sediminum TaxID=1247510 RepID=A0A556AIZ5_9BURK|nr:hypothetical protein [Verticiella sediminum]TSH92849.1 hypothetical protein FOZ76_15750 [Verticiella sediminum]